MKNVKKNKKNFDSNYLILKQYITETPNLVDKFKNSANDFLNHTKKLCSTAQQIALCTTHSRNKRTIELINDLTKRVLLFTINYCVIIKSIFLF